MAVPKVDKIVLNMWVLVMQYQMLKTLEKAEEFALISGQTIDHY